MYFHFDRTSSPTKNAREAVTHIQISLSLVDLFCLKCEEKSATWIHSCRVINNKKIKLIYSFLHTTFLSYDCFSFKLLPVLDIFYTIFFHLTPPAKNYWNFVVVCFTYLHIFHCVFSLWKMLRSQLYFFICDSAKCQLK